MADNDLNDVVEETVTDAEVITVPIDDTLSISGEAADAKAVGDALALKADRSELQNTITVNGQQADNQGVILVYAQHIPMDEGAGAQSVSEAVGEIREWDAGDLPMDREDDESPSIREAVEDIQDRSAAEINLTDDPEDGTVGAAIEALEADFTDAEIHQMLVAAGYEEEDA